MNVWLRDKAPITLPAWRHHVAPPPNPETFGWPEIVLDDSWRKLVMIHTTFRAIDQDEYSEIIDGLRRVERLFLDYPGLDNYYEECHQPPGTPFPTSDKGDDTEMVSVSSTRHRHVAAIQARLMERVYFVLRLLGFANALDNRGWMNLFRSWGQSPRFNEVFDSISSTLTSEFVEFYRAYLRYFPGAIEQYPVPHPWDSTTARRDPRVSGSSIMDDESEFRPQRGVFLDSGRQTESGPTPSPGEPTQGVGNQARERTAKTEDTGEIDPEPNQTIWPTDEPLNQ